jgi:hypothetical protein
VDERLHVVFIAAAEVGGDEDAKALAVERAAAGHGDVCNCEADAEMRATSAVPAGVHGSSVAPAGAG